MIQKIAIFCGGPSSEHEVSLNSAKNIYHFLDKDKYDPYYFYISKNLGVNFSKCTDDFLFEAKSNSPSIFEQLQKVKAENFFALLAGIHGEFAEDGQLQTFLEYYKIPYSGSNPSSSSLCMDKYRSTLLAKNIEDVLLPTTIYITAGLPKQNLPFPCIVKPNSLGSSVGLFIAHNETDLENAIGSIHSKFHQSDILIQELIEGTELSCGVLQKKDGSFVKIPPIEIRPIKSETFDYAAKYEVGGSEEITPPPSLSKELSDRISKISCEIHQLLGCSVYSRSDFRVKNGKIYFLETNTLPGMTSTSLLPQEAAAVGITFSALLDFIIENS